MFLFFVVYFVGKNNWLMSNMTSGANQNFLPNKTLLQGGQY